MWIKNFIQGERIIKMTTNVDKIEKKLMQKAFPKRKSLTGICYDCGKRARLFEFSSSPNAVWKIGKSVMLCKKCYTEWQESEIIDRKVWRAESGWAE